MTPKHTNTGISRRGALQSGIGGVAFAAAGISAQAMSSQDQKSVPAVSPCSGKISAPADQNVVETRAGKVRGFRRGPVYVFKGIPYSAATSGANRFSAPKPVEPWSGIRSAMSYGPSAPNSFGVAEPGARLPLGDEDAFLLYRGFEHTIQSEDCLRVNVWTPGLSATGKRPVMVFMHGGGFTGGSGNDLQSYEGTALAASQDVVVITHNHRLNVFGYLNLEQLGGERYRESANVGLLDIVAVLRWVQDNVAQFGGDPNQVMIFGQSGGGGKVNCLLAMPAAKGLFKAAAIESGSILRVADAEYSTAMAAEFLKQLGINGKDLSRLETASTEETMVAARKAAAKTARRGGPGARVSLKGPLPGWGPTRDGSTLPEHPCDPSAPAISAEVPVIIGTNEHEFINGVDNPEVDTLTEGEMRARVQTMFGEKSDKIVQAYRNYYPGRSPFDVYAAIAASGARSAAVAQGTRKAALKRAGVYEYIYAWRTPVLGGRPGTFHSAEIAMVFNNAAYCDRYTGATPEALALSQQMSAAWVSLVRTGKPHHPGLPEWAEYDGETRKTMIFDSRSRLVSNPEGEGLALIEAATADSQSS